MSTFHAFSALFPELQRAIVMRGCDAATQLSFFITCRTYWHGDAECATLPCYARDKRPPSSIARAIARHGYTTLFRELRWSCPSRVAMSNIDLGAIALHGHIPVLASDLDIDNVLMRDDFYRAQPPSSVYACCMIELGSGRPGGIGIDGRFLHILTMWNEELNTLPKLRRQLESTILSISTMLTALVLRRDVDRILRPEDAPRYAKFFDSYVFIEPVVAAFAIGRPDLLHCLYSSIRPLAERGHPLEMLTAMDESGASRRWLEAHYSDLVGQSNVPDSRELARLHGSASRMMAWIAFATKNDRFTPSVYDIGNSRVGFVPPPTSPAFVDALMAAANGDMNEIEGFLTGYAHAAAEQDRAEYVRGALDALIAIVPTLTLSRAQKLLQIFDLLAIPNVLSSQRAALINAMYPEDEAAYDLLWLSLNDFVSETGLVSAVYHLLRRPGVLVRLHDGLHVLRMKREHGRAHNKGRSRAIAMIATRYLDTMTGLDEAFGYMKEGRNLPFFTELYMMAGSHDYAAAREWQAAVRDARTAMQRAQQEDEEPPAKRAKLTEDSA